MTAGALLACRLTHHSLTVCSQAAQSVFLQISSNLVALKAVMPLVMDNVYIS